MVEGWEVMTGGGQTECQVAHKPEKLLKIKAGKPPNPLPKPENVLKIIRLAETMEMKDAN